MRKFSYITVGEIVIEMQQEVKDYYLQQHPELTSEEYDRLAQEKPKGVPTFERVQYYRLAKKLDFPRGEVSEGRWRKYKPEEKEEIKQKIRAYNVLPEPERV